MKNKFIVTITLALVHFSAISQVNKFDIGFEVKKSTVQRRNNEDVLHVIKIKNATDL